MEKKAGGYVPRKSGFASHFVVRHGSGAYNVCVLCNKTDANGETFDAFAATCYVGGSFCGTHTLEETPFGQRSVVNLNVRCTKCNADNKLGLMGPCYEILPTPETVPVDEKMIEETLEVTGEVEAFFDYGDAEITHSTIRADRDISAPKIGTLCQAIFIPDGAAGTYVRVADDEEVIETPYGQITGPAEAVRYCADLIADDVARGLEQSVDKTFEQELQDLLTKHGKTLAAGPLARHILCTIDLWEGWLDMREALKKPMPMVETTKPYAYDLKDYDGGDWGKMNLGPDAANWS